MDVRPKVSPAQTAEPVPRLTPQPPPEREPEDIDALRELIHHHMKHESLLSIREEYMKLSPIHVAVGKIFMESDTEPLPTFDPQAYFRYGIKADQRRAKMLREKRLEVYCLSQKDSGSLKPAPKLQSAKAKQTAQDANRKRFFPKKEAQLERKVAENEMEERVLPEPEEEVEVEEEVKEVVEEEVEVKESDLDDFADRIMWESRLFKEEMDEEEPLIRSLKWKEKIQEKVNQSEMEVQKMALLIKQEEDKLKNLKCQMSNKYSVLTKRLRIKQYCEKLVEIYKEIFDRSCSTHFPDIIVVDLDELTSELMENLTDETRAKLLKRFWKRKAMIDRMEYEAEMKARQMRRIQQRREIALAPRVKKVGKKLIPRMLPPKKEKVEKKEPVEPKNQ